MNYEKYIPVYRDFEQGTLLQPEKEGAEFSFALKREEGKAFKLYVAGETAQSYLKKCEPACTMQYHSISDALNTEHAVHNSFCLDFSQKTPEKYVKRCFHKFLWKPMLYYIPMSPVPAKWSIGINASAKNLRLEQGGYVRMRADVRLLKPGVERKSTHANADITYILDIPEGTYTDKCLSKEITVPENTASVSLFVEGKLYSGSLYAEAPLFGANGENLAPDFAPDTAGISDFNWRGQHFSRKEWPEFYITLNGEPVFSGEIFERCHRSSDWEIPLPDFAVRDGLNTLKISLTSSFRGALAYNINELAVLQVPASRFTVISHSQVAPVGGYAYALIRTREENVKITVTADSAFSSEGEFFFEKAGLHGIRLNALAAATNVCFTVSDEVHEEKCAVEAVIYKGKDSVVTGTGDMVFIKQAEYDMTEYLSWYFANNIGNMITIRPTYRWSGTRHLNEAVMRDAARLFNELGVFYVHMADGRENPGLASCPPDSVLQGEYYLGRQAHERDGQAFYWSSEPLKPEGEADFDMRLEIFREEPLLTQFPANAVGVFENGRVYQSRSVNVAHDAVLAHDYTIKLLGGISKASTRHTGPSYAFKYMLESGYKWVGAETMYSTIEILMAFLRGAAHLYGLDTFGVHHAVQWSTTPHEREDHYRRYRIALYSSYMLGATDINTEEGLYRMEESYERFGRHSECCKNHLIQQQDFYRYISRHTRTGRFYSSFAFIHGKYDGTNGFVGEKCWGWQNTPLTEAERSWDLLKLFYPDSRPNANIYCRGDFPTDKPLGFNSFASMGHTDVIPVEDHKAFSDYKVLAFLGYNLYDEENSAALSDFVSNGGTLVLTRAHLSVSTDYEEVKSNRLKFEHGFFTFSDAKPQFGTDSYCGVSLDVCLNADEGEVIQRTDSGAPLVIRYQRGKGAVILFNTPLYPANEAIRALYEEILKEEKLRVNEAEPLIVKEERSVEYAVYRQEDGAYHIYFLAIDWYNTSPEERRAVIMFDGGEYEIRFPFGRMVKCVYKNKRAVWADSEDGEILSVDEKIRVQGTGKMNIYIAEKGKITKVPVDFSDYPVTEI